jgi:hypothetical protein
MHNTLEVEFTRRAEMLACGQQHHRAFDFGKSFFLALSFVKKVPTIHTSIWKELPHRSMKNSQFIIDQLFDLHHFLRKTRSHLKNTSEEELSFPLVLCGQSRFTGSLPAAGRPYNGTRHAVWRGIQSARSGLPTSRYKTAGYTKRGSVRE